MSDKITMGSMADRLLGFVNTAQIHDSNYDIALMLVKNYERVKHMSIKEMAELCYVSQASISRFCRFMGFENFRDFRESLDHDFTLLDDYSRQFHSLLKSNDAKAIQIYRDELVRNIESVLAEDNFHKIRACADLFTETERIAFFSHHFLWDIGKYFQSKMIMMDRYVELFQSYDHQKACADSLTKKDTAIICSIGGSYFSYYSRIFKSIVDSGARLIVLTQNTRSIYTNRAELIIECGETNHDDVGKYAVLAVIDLIVMQYMKRNLK